MPRQFLYKQQCKEGEEKEDKRSAERIISDWTGDRVEVLARNVQTLKTKSNETARSLVPRLRVIIGRGRRRKGSTRLTTDLKRPN